MFCQKCGKVIDDEAVVCIGCGCAVQKPAEIRNEPTVDHPKRESDSTANCALIFAFLIPIVGLIMGIVGVAKYETPKYRQRCITAIILSVVVWVVCFLLLAAMGL